MAIIVKLKYLRITARKVRLIANLIRGKSAAEAETLLEFARKKAAYPVAKLLKSAIATAEHDFQLEKSNLFVSKIMVDEGPTLKRSRFRGFGKIMPIMKRTSHITLILDEIKPGAKKKTVAEPKKPKEEPKEKPEVQEVKETKEGPKPEKKAVPKSTFPKPRLDRGLKRIFRRKAF